MAEYIEREAALEAVKKEREYVGKFSFEKERAWGVGFHQGISFALSDIAAIPAENVAPVRHGRWLKCKPYNPEFNGYKCSECGAKYQGFSPDNYCPNCGALMDKED